MVCCCCCSTKRTVGIPTEFMAARAGGDASYYQSTGVQKAVTLARYTDLLQGW